MNKVRSYANSYLYTKIPDYERNILEFVMGAERIDKNSEMFYGVIEDVKRRQTSAVLSRVLARDDVVLCTYNKPLPASFKVFACKDVKTDQKVKVFIDLTGLITVKNGFYTINKIDIFCSYLLSAMTNIIYNEDATKLFSNSTIIQTSTECFVDLSSHIFDYLRVNGYSENKNKISYILAIYFQSTILGLDRTDTSVKNLASKISTIPARDINAMEIYFDDEDLVNINTLITSLANTFKMKGVGTDTFIEKWTWFYGVGTQFGTELFPAFASMLTDAYCGAYVNNQKTIEKCCGRDMVTFTTTLLRIGGDTIDKGGYRYESALDRDVDKNHLSVTQEALFHKKISKEMKISIDDLKGDKNNLKKKIDTLAKEAYDNKKEASKGMKGIYLSAIGTTSTNYLEKGSKETYNNMISTTVSAIKPYLNKEDKDYIINGLSNSITNMVKPNAVSGDYKNRSLVLKDCKAALKMLDPSSPMLKESGDLFEKENEKMLDEAIEELNNLCDMYMNRLNADQSILEDYLTEDGILSNIKNAISAIFKAIRDFFSSLFGKAQEKVEEKEKEVAASVPKDTFEDEAKLFKENYKKVKITDRNPDTNFIQKLQKQLLDIEALAKSDMYEIKSPFTSINSMIFDKFTKEDYDKFVDQTKAQVEKIIEHIPVMTGDITYENIFLKKDSTIDEKVLDFAQYKNTGKPVGEIHEVFDKAISKMKSDLDAWPKSQLLSIDMAEKFGAHNPDGENHYYVNDVNKVVYNSMLDILKAYCSNLEKLGTQMANGYNGHFLTDCRNVYRAVLKEAKGSSDTSKD